MLGSIEVDVLKVSLLHVIFEVFDYDEGSMCFQEYGVKCSASIKVVS